MTTHTTRTGREYLRVSLDKGHQARSVTEQHGDNERAATTRDVRLGDAYQDNDRSASRYATKTRDDFARLLTDLESGAFGADELWLWESSRGSRKVSEWVALLEACESAGVVIYVTTHGRTYDPANGRDRRSLLEDAVDSEYESSKLSTRAKRSTAARAVAGEPHGQAPFGYVRRYDERTRRMIAQEPDPVEAPVVRELFSRLKAGHSLRSIAADFNGRGIRNRSGRPFSAQHLRALALNASYAALRVYDPDGKKAGRRHARPGMPGVEVTQGTWEPLVTKADYLKVSRTLTDPARVTTRPGRARHLLSMIALCDACGGPLAVTTRTAEPEYQCHHKGCVRVRKAELDALGEAVIVAYLSRPDVVDVFAGGDDESPELVLARGDLAEAKARLEEAYDSAASPGGLSPTALARIEPRLLEAIASLEARVADLSAPSALSGLITPGDQAAEQWAALSVESRRVVARLLLAPGLVGELRVQRRPEGRRNIHVPVLDRIRWGRDAA